MRFDTVIANGTVYGAGADGTQLDIGIVGEKIAAVSAAGTLAADAGRVIDAAGMEVIPGCIDVHVHLELPFCGTVSCDDFDSGSRAAAAGCVTSLIDFAIPGKGESLADAHAAWRRKAEGKSLVDYSWHMAITNKRHIAEIPAMVKLGLPTFKEFMIYESEGWNADDAMMFATLEAVKQHDGMLLVHAESPRLLDLLIERRHTPEEMKKYGARLHAMTRPNVVEVEAIERCIRWSKATGGKLYIVHMSTGEGADLVLAARKEGVPVLAETCVQYLVLTDDVFSKPDGHLYACCPQVKKPADVERLWRGVSEARGEVCVVSTDTCSFTREQKGMWWNREGRYGDWTQIPMGLPGLDTLVPLMYTLGVRGGKISMGRLVELCSTAPARVMGMGERKGRLAPGYDADIAIIDPEYRKVVRPGAAGGLQSRCDWNPFDGHELGGWAWTTLVRGAPVVEDYKVVGKNGHGKRIERQSPGAL